MPLPNETFRLYPGEEQREADMRPELIAACQMFLVPSTIMFAALGVAGSEGLKTIICVMGAATSDIWIWTICRWKDVPSADSNMAPSDTKPVLVLSCLFAAAWGICFFVHLTYGYVYGFERQKETQAVFFSPRPKMSFTLRPRPAFSRHRLWQRLWRRLQLVRQWWTGRAPSHP